MAAVIEPLAKTEAAAGRAAGRDGGGGGRASAFSAAGRDGGSSCSKRSSFARVCASVLHRASSAGGTISTHVANKRSANGRSAGDAIVSWRSASVAQSQGALDL